MPLAIAVATATKAWACSRGGVLVAVRVLLLSQIQVINKFYSAGACLFINIFLPLSVLSLLSIDRAFKNDKNLERVHIKRASKIKAKVKTEK